jgi:hypothetical protein
MDQFLKIIWLIIGVAVLAWIGLVRVPQEWQNWERQRDRARHHRQMTPREPGVIVGEQAAQDRGERLRRQGLRFSMVLDPRLKAMATDGFGEEFREDDWLLVPVSLATFEKPRAIQMASRDHDPAADYTWKHGAISEDYATVRLQAVNIVFYRRDGSAERLLVDRPAWIQSVLLPRHAGDLYFYEMAIADTNGDDRIDGDDGLTLWSSRPDGTDLRIVWLPQGEVAPTRYREPVSGDVFGTVVKDTDHDGAITEYDRHELFRIAIGDTVAEAVVSEQVVEEIEAIVFGGGASSGQ